MTWWQALIFIVVGGVIVLIALSMWFDHREKVLGRRS
jgi:hypothetical protein